MSESKAVAQPPNGKQERLFHGSDDSPRDRCWKKAYKCVSVAWFMGSYYLMLTVCFVILAYILWKGTDSFESSANEIYSMEIVSGIMLGFFSILATFTVVFFALRAEEAARNSSRSVVQEIMDEAFNGEEEEIANLLLNTEQNTNESSLTGNKSNASSNRISLLYFSTPERDSIYFGVASHIPQFFMWLLVLVVMSLSIFLAYKFWISHHLLNAQTLIALSVGILSALITLTVVLFALRAAQFSQVAGRIASYSVIERMAAVYEQEYQKLLETFLALLVQEQLLTGPRRYFTPLNKALNRSQQDSFDLLRKCERCLVQGFSFFLVLCAIFIFGCFVFIMRRFGFTELGVNLIIILFIFLIFFVTVFFLGRVFLSAIGSSEIWATEMTRSELKHQKNLLHDRITSIEEIKSVLANYLGADPKAIAEVEIAKSFTGTKTHGIFEDRIADLFAPAGQKADEHIKDISQIRLHLRYLQVAGTGKNHDAGENRQFRWICNYLEKLWTQKFEKMEFVLLKLKNYALLGEEIEATIIERVSKARQEDKILMKLQQEQMREQNLIRGAGGEMDEKLLNLFGDVSLLGLILNKGLRTLIKLWEKVKIEPSELEKQYKKEATSENLDLEELKERRRFANSVFHDLLVIIWLELAVVRLKKAVSGLPQFQMVEEGEFYNSDWPYVKFLQELRPVFLDTIGPQPILDDYHLRLLEEINKAPELSAILHRDSHQDSG